MSKGTGGTASSGRGTRPAASASAPAGTGFSRVNDEREGQLALPFINSLTGNQSTALDVYTGSGYSKMNRFLRGDLKTVPGDIKQNIRELRGALNRPVGANIIVNRGYQSSVLWAAAKAGKIKGAVVQEKGFMSTSLNSRISRSFAVRDENQVLMRIRVGKNAKGAVLGGRSQGPEREVILNAGTKVKITSARFVTRKNGKQILVVSATTG